ncbi:MAG: hypothetical protein HZC40_26785 [Chloroflexi bacterium]|nr:hypothetical protein [Chloroflexota bacterium]
MDPILIALRLIHILAGIYWAGAAVLVAAFLTPAVRAMGSDGGKFMQQLVGKQQFSLYLSLAAYASTFAGIVLYWRASLGFQIAWIIAPSGLMFTIGSLAGIITVVMGQLVNAPTAARMSALANEMQSAGAPPQPAQIAEMQKLQTRLGQAGVIAAILLIISASAMAIARYV